MKIDNHNNVATRLLDAQRVRFPILIGEVDVDPELIGGCEAIFGTLTTDPEFVARYRVSAHGHP